MPADDSLYPAHVVALRPEVEGSQVDRGDYVLSVETRQGTRNVMAPMGGTVSIEVALMEELAPDREVFNITHSGLVTDAPKSSPTEPAPAPASTKPKDAQPSTAAKEVPPKKARWGIRKTIFSLIILVLAIILPGLVPEILEGDADLNLGTAVVAGSLGLGLLIFTWLTGSISFLSGFSRRMPMAIFAVLAFAGALVAGLNFPALGQIQREFVAPVVEFAKPPFRLMFDSLGIQRAKTPDAPSDPEAPATSKAPSVPEAPSSPEALPAVTELPVGRSTPSSASEPLLGDIILVGFNFCPRGWTAADGRLLPISSYNALFSLYGTTYGGDGRSTFAIPDLRGRAPMHAGAGPGFDNKSLGQRGGIENIATTPDPSATKTGTPHLTMNYCIALQGNFPPRN